MVELTIPFWFASCVLSETESINSWLKTQKVQPRWIDEVIRVTEPGLESGFALTGIESSALQFGWSAGQFSDHKLLQAACREIAMGERSLALLLSCRNHQRTAVLLAAPTAVGMYNLVPLAYVEELFTLQIPSSDMDLLAALEIAIIKKGKKAEQLKELLWLQNEGKRPVKSNTAFTAAQWVSLQGRPAGILPACHELVQVLLQKKQVNGLAVEVDASQHLFATWIERI
jgi:hypothetical protein